MTIRLPLIFLLILLGFFYELSAQCGSGGLETNSPFFYSRNNTYSTQLGSNAYVRMQVVNGLTYNFNTCAGTAGGHWDTQITLH